MNDINFDTGNLMVPLEPNVELEDLIRQYGKECVYPARHIFLEPGTYLKEVIYIKSGRTRHYMMGSDGAEKILYTLSDGWFFGETPCSVKEPTGLFSKTEIKTTLYKIPSSIYQELLDNNKIFRDAVFESYSKKMLIMRYEIANLTFNSCKDRLKKLFCSTIDTSEIVENKWYKLKVSYTQYELSTIVGGARVTVNKLINELCSDGFIRILNRNIQVNVAKCKDYSDD
ncbi:MAG: Crp/Fnr family transcriptional regulator [Lacrimispora sphenoides]